MSKRRYRSLDRKTRFLLLLVAVAAALVLHFLPKDEGDRPSTPTDGSIAVHFLDVGQGDATLILTPDGEAMLIDTGVSEYKDELVSYIQACDITTLSYLVLTHPHADHIGGAVAVLDAFTVKEVVMPDATTTTVTFEKVLNAIDKEGCKMTVPEPEDTLSLGTCRLTVLGPVKDYPKDLNAMSLVLRLDYGSTSFLFTGDAESQSEEDMLNRFSSSVFKADVLKLGHHGSATSSSSDFIDAVSPSYAVASCGKDNEYGHPHREVIADMEERGIALYRTDRDGSIVFSSDGTKVTLLAS